MATRTTILDEFVLAMGRPIDDLCCVNADCADRGRCGAGNLRVRRGKGGGRWRILACSTGKKEFSDRSGTALWGSRMPPERARAIAKHLVDGKYVHRTPAMAMGIETQPLTVAEIISTQVVGFRPTRAATPAIFREHHAPRDAR